jgi:hypothetical protein
MWKDMWVGQMLSCILNIWYLHNQTPWLLIDCVSATYSYIIAFVLLTYLSTYCKFSVHFEASSCLKYVWITHSKCGSAILLEQLEEFVNTKVILTYPNHRFYLCGENSIVKYLVDFIVLLIVLHCCRVLSTFWRAFNWCDN